MPVVSPGELRELDRRSFRQAIRLRVAPEQDGFVVSNVYSLAESAVTPDTWPLAVYADGEMVGFVMYSREPETGRYWILRLMIDAARRYGRIVFGGSQRVLEDYTGIVNQCWGGELGKFKAINVNVGPLSQQCNLPC